MRILYFSEVTYNISLVLVKYSALAFYLRLFPVPFMIWGVWTTVAIATGWVLSTTLAIIFQCQPVQKTWNREIPGHCINIKAFYVGQAVPHIITDIIILLLPVRVIYKLEQPLSKRLAIICVFLLGSL